MTNGSTVQPERPKTAMIPAWNQAKWLVVDLETTGLSSRDTIIEIGAAVYENRELVDSFSALINPGSPLPSFITALTGLDDETLVHAPDLHIFASGQSIYAIGTRFQALSRTISPLIGGFLCELNGPAISHCPTLSLSTHCQWLAPCFQLRYPTTSSQHCANTSN